MKDRETHKNESDEGDGAIKVIAVSASSRNGGDSDVLCDQFLKGAGEAVHQTEKICIGQKNISLCMACRYCTDSCPKKISISDLFACLRWM